MRWLPRRMSVRIIVLTMFALAVSQTVSYINFTIGRDRFVQRLITGYLSEGVPAIDRVLGHVRAGEQAAATAALSTRFAHYALTDHPLVCPRADEARPAYAKDLADKLGLAPAMVRVCVGAGLSDIYTKRPGIGFSVRRDDGAWLEVRAVRPARFERDWLYHALRDLAITMAIVVVAVIVTSRRIVKPLSELADAAERFGRGETIEPVAERGSEEIRRSIAEFNRMHERIERFVAERTHLVAALAHDLRTPITALRLRLEFLPEDDNTRAMHASLEDMADMSEAALTFLREEAATELSRNIDLVALVDALCEDYRAASKPVEFAPPETRITLVCRPVAIRRAVRNVIDNALAYGSRADVRVSAIADAFVIDVVDDGPGIDEAQMATVFEAFVRLETSRSRETGGVGLGLAIARTAIRAHGGDITLYNRPAGGLRVRMTIPRARRRVANKTA